MAFTSRWYDPSETAELLVVLRSLRRGDRTLLTEPELQRLLNAIDVEIDHYQRSLSIEIDRMIALLPPSRRRMPALRHAVADARSSRAHLHALMRLHRRLCDEVRDRTPRARLRRDLRNLKNGKTSIRALLTQPQGSPAKRPGRGRPLVVARVYRDELVLALRVGARKAGVVSPDAVRVLSILDGDPEKLRRACDAVLCSKLLRERQDRDELLEHLELGLLGTYEDHLNVPPAESVSKSKRGKRPGPAIRFLQACRAPLTTPPKLDAARHRIRSYRRSRASRSP